MNGITDPEAIPTWYVERSNEDADVFWLPVLFKTWVFDGVSVSTMRAIVGVRTRGSARAYVAKEWGESFTTIRARKVWMRSRPATFEEECEYGPRLDMAEECPRDADGALPYWRLAYVRPRVAS